jgi:predicted RNA binding protein YcfA (HicA-like mRNA interferase family)
MPRKIRELKRDLRQAGFMMRAGKGNHSVWRHPEYDRNVAISGNDGTDAPAYLEREVQTAISAVRRK